MRMRSSPARSPLFAHRLMVQILAIVIATFACLPLSAQTYDAEADFSEVSNPSPGGIWRYGWSDDLNSAMVLYNEFVPAPQYDIWHDTGNSHPTWMTPLVQHNPNDTASGPHPPHSLSLHPSDDGDYSASPRRPPATTPSPRRSAPSAARALMSTSW